MRCQVGVVIDIPPDLYELIRLVVHLTDFLFGEYGGFLLRA